MELPEIDIKSKIPSHAKKVFEGVLFDVYQWEQEMFDGSFATFERIKRTDSSSVIAVTPENKIVITKQEQPGLSLYYGTLGGRVDEGENAFQCAQRELLEEAGMVSDEWKFWDYHQASSYVQWVDYLFVAKNCKKIHEPTLDAGEKIELLELSFDEFIAIAQSNLSRDLQLKMRILEALNDETKMKALKDLLFN